MTRVAEAFATICRVHNAEPVGTGGKGGKGREAEILVSFPPAPGAVGNGGIKDAWTPAKVAYLPTFPTSDGGGGNHGIAAIAFDFERVATALPTVPTVPTIPTTIGISAHDRCQPDVSNRHQAAGSTVGDSVAANGFRLERAKIDRLRDAGRRSTALLDDSAEVAIACEDGK
jgi:hypothetical protein